MSYSNNKKTRSHTPLRALRIQQIIKGFLSSSTIYCNTSGYRFVNLDLKKHSNFKRFLHKIGFFHFHSTNSGRVVSVHQIIAFVYKGFKAFKNGFIAPKGQVEIHHLDSCPYNNSPENLVYVSPQEHQIISDSVGTGYIPFFKYPSFCEFNQQGKTTSQPKQRLAYLIKLTFEATMSKLDKPIKVNTPEILLYLPYKLFVEKTRGAVDTPLTRHIVKHVKSLLSKGKNVFLLDMMNFNCLKYL